MRNRRRLLVVLFILGASVLVNGFPPDQPNMESARDYLQKARGELQVAEPNKGGHRTKAINIINNAIAEVNKGIAYARTHGHHARLTPEPSVSPDQPHMQAALGFLQSAKESLVKANPDKGGHRSNAIKLVEAAITEVNSGIAAAN